MQSYILDYEYLQENNIEDYEFLVLLKITKNNKISTNDINILESLQNKKFIKLLLDDDEIVMREKGNLLIESISINKQALKKNSRAIRKSKRLINNDIDEFVEEFRSKWKGLKPGSMGTPKACKEKMLRWMSENPTYTKEQILNAADMYINSLESFKYLQQADYFIYKKLGSEEQSRLSAFIDESLETEEWKTKLI